MRAAFRFIFIALALDMLALGIISPVLPRLIMQLQGGDEASAAHWVGWFGTIWAVMQFATMATVGALSDTIGRRPVMLLSMFGQAINYVIIAMAPNLWWLMIGQVISGVTSSSVSTAMAYVADVTLPRERASAFGKLSAAFGLGFMIGPALGGLVGQFDPRAPFWVAGALSALNGLYGLFVLPESLPPERRAPFAWKRANPVGSLVLLRSHYELFGLAIVAFLSYLAHVVLPSVAVLYLGYRYGWGTKAVGLTLAAVGICAMIVQGVLVKPLTARFGERRTLLAGLLCGAVGFSIYGLAPNPVIYCLGIPIMAFWGLVGPSAQSLMTRRVGASEQGQLQGAIASLAGIAGLLGPSLFTLTFALFIDRLADWHLPGAPFLLAAGLLLLGWALAWRATAPERPVLSHAKGI